MIISTHHGVEASENKSVRKVLPKLDQNDQTGTSVGQMLKLIRIVPVAGKLLPFNTTSVIIKAWDTWAMQEDLIDLLEKKENLQVHARNFKSGDRFIVMSDKNTNELVCEIHVVAVDDD